MARGGSKSASKVKLQWHIMMSFLGASSASERDIFLSDVPYIAPSLSKIQKSQEGCLKLFLLGLCMQASSDKDKARPQSSGLSLSTGALVSQDTTPSS